MRDYTIWTEHGEIDSTLRDEVDGVEINVDHGTSSDSTGDDQADPNDDDFAVDATHRT